MTVTEKRWIERLSAKGQVETLATALGIMPLTARVLANRGLAQPEVARDFFHAKLSSLPDPDLLPDMELAVSRLEAALSKGEKITVHGDYDVDGITGTALLVESLRAFGAEVDYHIPLRMKDGYGLSAEAITRASEVGCSLILSVDCGVSALTEAALAAELKLDLIVTDHHQPP